MTSHTFNFYDNHPMSNGFVFGSPGTTFAYTGPATADGVVIITDTEAGVEGQFLDNSETATADASIGGLTSTGSGVRAVRGWVIEDTVTAERFTVVQMVIEDDPAAGDYTLSETPLVAGRSYELVGWASSVSAGDPRAFNYSEYVCFAAGTLISTPDGPRRVEDLGPGDTVLTHDGGVKPLIWTGHRHLMFGKEVERHRPILIPKGSLGDKRPTRDLLLSPQHKVLLRMRDGVQNDAKSEFFAIAKALVSRRGIRSMEGKRAVTYYTLMTAQHEVIFANGLAVETFYPGDVALGLLSKAERIAVGEAFCAIRVIDAKTYGPPARRTMRKPDVRGLGAVFGVGQKLSA